MQACIFTKIDRTNVEATVKGSPIIKKAQQNLLIFVADVDEW